MSSEPSDEAGRRIAAVVAAQRPRLLGGLIRVTGDWETAEDCVQDAVERALVAWPRDGLPDNPAAWLTTAAKRRALDLLRRRQIQARTLQEVAAMESTPADDPDLNVYRDDQLRLLFTCCHPALPMAGRVALTLKSVTGLSVGQIARAFLVGEATMSQRLLRARNKIQHAGIRFQVPEGDRLAERTADVLAVIYLVFTTGYAEGETDLAAEAIRLGHWLVELLPADDEARSLLALMMFHHARRAARIDSRGLPVPMEEQDRSLWSHSLIDAAVALLDQSSHSNHGAEPSGGPVTGKTRLVRGSVGPYRRQAEIARLHSTATSVEDTDWAAVVIAYDELMAMIESPVVALNRAVAIGFRDGPLAGLSELEDLAGRSQLRDYFLLPATEAEFARRAGLFERAATAYRLALTQVENRGEREFLRRRLGELPI